MNDIKSVDTFGVRSAIHTQAGNVHFYRLDELARQNIAAVDSLPFSIKVILEGVLRRENGTTVTRDAILSLAQYDPRQPDRIAIPYLPARVLMQDFTGVPALVDLAALRSETVRHGLDPELINPVLPVDLVIDHSVQADEYGSSEALRVNTEMEFARNRERYEFLHWGQKAFRNFRVAPPASGICHQVNLEYLGKVVCLVEENGDRVAFPDSLVGCDSHTTMINGLGILGWGVGGIEAEAVLLGQPYFMMMPEVIGFCLTGSLAPGVTATDLVLTVTQLLREKGVVGKFIEFYGPGLSNVSLPDRATIANMAPECGSRCSFFPVDHETINYLRYTGRPDDLVDLVERYTKEQGLFRTDQTSDPVFKETLVLDLGTVQPSLAGPKRPQDRIFLSDMKKRFNEDLTAPIAKRGFALSAEDISKKAVVDFPGGHSMELTHGDVVIAAITSCTNTSNPRVLLAAGLLARKAVEAGLTVKPHVKTSLAPGSKVVTEYLNRAGLTPYFEQLNFHTVGYGCTTCIGNSGPLPDHVVQAIETESLVVAAVLSGNRNFEGRISPYTRANYLASPPLVVAYALAGNVNLDLTKEPIGKNSEGKEIFLRDIWPSEKEINGLLNTAQDPETYHNIYQTLLTGNETWNRIPSLQEPTYAWREDSSYIQEPPFFVNLPSEISAIEPIHNARILVMLGDSVTTDHISPAGAIAADMPAGRYLIERGVQPIDFNTYGSRRGNDRIMTRGTFANIRIRNQLAPETEGGFTTYMPTGEVTTIYEAAMKYQQAGIATLVIAGSDYGMGSSRDWAAKGTRLLGVKAVLARSFETIHRSNLIGMGVLPLQFAEGESAETHGITGKELFSIDLDDALQPRQEIPLHITMSNGGKKTISTICRVDTPIEVEYYRHGGILNMALRQILSRSEDNS